MIVNIPSRNWRRTIGWVTVGPMIFTCIHLEHPLMRESLGEVPGIEIEWERVDTAADAEMLFWARGSDFEAFDAALADDRTVSTLRSIDVGDRRLYQVRLTGEGTDAYLYPVFVETVSLVGRATATYEGWRCEFYFADQSALERFVEACRERNIGFQVVRLQEWQDVDGEEFGLTDTQRETLETALEVGYFAVPREHDLQDLADRLGVSDTAASQRLRRGLSTLLQRTVGRDHPTSS